MKEPALSTFVAFHERSPAFGVPIGGTYELYNHSTHRVETWKMVEKTEASFEKLPMPYTKRHGEAVHYGLAVRVTVQLVQEVHVGQ